MMFWIWGHGVFTTFRPRVTPRQPFDTQPDAFYWSPFLDGFHGIMRAGRMKATGWWKQGRDDPLINTNGKNEQCFEKLTHFFFEFAALNEALTGIE